MHYSLFYTHESKAKMNKTKEKKPSRRREKKNDKETKAKDTCKTQKAKLT
jgi:hypothetical protein